MGRRTNSLILDADGKHVLTDSWTGFGVVGGLVLVLLTHWKPLDPLVAVAVAANILWSGGHLVWRSAIGLLDYSVPNAGRKIGDKLDVICSELAIEYHGVWFRTTGYRQIIEVHLLFPHSTSVGEANRLATVLEERLPVELGMPAENLRDLSVAKRRASLGIVSSSPGRSVYPFASPLTLGVATSNESRPPKFPGRIHRNTPSLTSLRMVRRFSRRTRSHDDFPSIGK